MNLEQTILRIKNAGVMINAQIEPMDTIVVNGFDNEPLIQTNKILLKNQAEIIIHGLKIVMEMTKAQNGILKINSENEKCVKAFLPKDGSIRIEFVDHHYLIDAKNLNISDLYQIFYAVSGKPVTHQLITVAGEVNKPIVVNVPIGTSYHDLLNMAEGTTIKSFSVLDGGPMTGKIVNDLENGITKNSNALMVLSNEHFIVTNQKRSPSQLKAITNSVCEVLASDVLMLIPSKMETNHKLSMNMLKMKLGILKYDDVKPIFIGNKNSNRVRINTKVSKPQVKLGQLVQMSDVIASGSHASIDGKITDISDSVIEITNEGYTV